MTIKIHRGEDQIGGSIVELSSGGNRILLDAGCELDEGPVPSLPEVEGLFDRPAYDGVFFSHNHLDHYGLAASIHNEIPLYMGAGAYRLLEAAARYKGAPLPFTCKTFRPQEQIRIGVFTITPLLVDHSAFDAYMFHVDDGQETLLYTGDFRATGRKSFDGFLRRLPAADTLICEGTTLSRPEASQPPATETDLENAATEIMRRSSAPVFIWQSGMNIDRMVTMYRAAKKSGRLFLQELYMAELATAADHGEDKIPNPLSFADVKAFVTRPYDKEHFRYQLLDQYGRNKIGKKHIAKEKFAMCVRSSMGSYMKSLRRERSFEGGVLIYSLWEGYQTQKSTADFLQLCEDLGLTVISLHTSGHADANTITMLVNHVNPRRIIPIHTENAQWFRALV